MDVRAILAVLTATLACATASPGDVPYCLSPSLRAETPIDCRADPEVGIYRGDLVAAIDGELRSEHFASLGVSAEFDPIESMPSVCIARDPSSVPWVVRQELTRANAKLRSFRAGPACVAGTRLDLTESLAASQRKQREPSVTPTFTIRGAR